MQESTTVEEFKNVQKNGENGSLYKMLVFQCSFAVLIVFTVLIFKLIGGPVYSEIKEFYFDKICDDTNVEEIFKKSNDFIENDYTVIINEH